ncbi:MAG: dihydrofolate reductase [Betaproteobacteria bacterium]|nr:dihydrofolate reductase [Betaproteobacteria bacterium]
MESSAAPPNSRPVVTLLVAVARNRVIGAQGQLPWHLPEDLARFRAVTMGHAIVMGRKTFESIGRLLPGRRSIIVTRNTRYVVPGAETVPSVEAALSLSADDSDVFVIGGGEVYAHALPLADRILLTEVDLDPPGDTWFPPIDPARWREVSRERHTSRTGIGFAYVEYATRRDAPAADYFRTQST